MAQEAAPPDEEEFAPEGVGFFPLGYGARERLPAAPADLVTGTAYNPHLVIKWLTPASSIGGRCGEAESTFRTAS